MSPQATPAAVDTAKPATSPFLRVEDLRVHFPTPDGVVKSVDGVSFEVSRGEVLGIVGESGSGKSVTSQAILGLQKGTKAKVSGKIWLGDNELVGMSEDEIRKLRGSEMSMIFQDPLSSLHPFYTVGQQIDEAFMVANKVSKKEAKERTIEMLNKVGIPNAKERYSEYPHQFSGGMRQRAMIAMALVCHPQLLIADEPTTALDVTVQAQILELIMELHKEFNSAVILITHDLGVVAETCDKVVVMYGGQCVEKGTVEDIFYRPQMPYTWGLLGSMPRMDRMRMERLKPIPGSIPSLIDVPAGCVFSNRCPYAKTVEGDKCFSVHPELLPVDGEPGHEVRCHIPEPRRRQIQQDEILPSL